MHMCPSCGYNLQADEVLTRGDWTIAPTWANHLSQRIKLTPAEHGVLYAIAASGNRPIKPEAILNRISDSENTNLVSVYVCRLRRKLGQAVPFELAGYSIGYRWLEA